MIDNYQGQETIKQICSNTPRRMTTKVMTVRLSEDLAAELAVVARTDDMPVSESVREAIERHIASRRADKDFQRRLKKRVEQEREILKRIVE